MTTSYYVDASALVKRYRLEAGSEVIDALFGAVASGDGMFMSSLGVLEVAAALNRLAAARAIASDTLRGALSRFRSDVQDSVKVWPVSDEVVNEGLAVVSEHALRAGDALHLATARIIGTLVPPNTLCVVTSDRELLRASLASGLQVLDPAQSGALEALGGSL